MHLWNLMTKQKQTNNQINKQALKQKQTICRVITLQRLPNMALQISSKSCRRVLAKLYSSELRQEGLTTETKNKTKHKTNLHNLNGLLQKPMQSCQCLQDKPANKESKTQSNKQINKQIHKRSHKQRNKQTQTNKQANANKSTSKQRACRTLERLLQILGNRVEMLLQTWEETKDLTEK